MFTLADFTVFGMPGLIEAFEKGFEIQGEVFPEAWEELEEYEKDYYYEDFAKARRWDISQALIYQFREDGKFYRIWHEVDLTEMQETYFEDQIPQVVEQKRKVITFWD